MGNCDSHATSAPSDPLLSSSSKMVATLPCATPLYASATASSSDRDRNAVSTPPQNPCSSGVDNAGGRSRPSRPRYARAVP